MIECFPIFPIYNDCQDLWSPTVSLALMKCVMAPDLFLVPSALNTRILLGNFKVLRLYCFTVFGCIKLEAAPLSMRAVAGIFVVCLCSIPILTVNELDNRVDDTLYRGMEAFTSIYSISVD